MRFLGNRQLALLLGVVVAFMISWTVLRKDPSAATDSARDARPSVKRVETREPSPENPGLDSTRPEDAPRASASRKPRADIAPGIRRMPQDADLVVTSVPVGGDLIKPVVKINDAGRQVRQRMIHANFKYPMLAVEEPIDGEPADQNNPYANSHVADHLIVSVNAGVNEAQVQAMADELGLTVRNQVKGSPFYLLSFPVRDFSSLDQARDLLKQRNEIKLVDLDSMFHVAAIPNDARYGDMYNMSKIQAPSAWNITTGSRAVTVAVLDSGIDYNHPDLAANIWSNPGETGFDALWRDKRSNGVDDDGNGMTDDWRGWNFISDNNDPMDGYSHGTHCAGIIGAGGNNSIGVAGVCWQVSLVPVKMFNDVGNGSSFDLIAGIHYAADSGFDIVSMSLAAPTYSASIQTALEYAKTKGLLCVSAAGNADLDTDANPRSLASHILDNHITVMGTGAEDNIYLSSNYGLTTISLAAPGIGILSTMPNNGYALKTGTSMSAPLVAGACALLKSYNPSLTPVEIKQAIMAGVDVVPGLSGKCVSGGRLNVYKSLTLLTHPLPTYVSSSFTEAVFGDGNINPGEDAVGAITLDNFTLGPVTGMVGHLSTSDPEVIVINDTINYGTLNVGQTTSGSSQYRVRLNAGSTPRIVELLLTVTSDTGGRWTFPVRYSCVKTDVISGYVRSSTGSAIAGATVSWSGTASGQVSTGADGSYSISEVDGSYSLTASAPGFVSRAPVSLTVSSYLTQDLILDFYDLSITPNPLSLQAVSGQTASSPLTLTNTGSLPVIWSMATDPYQVTTSAQVGGPAYVWNDISATGTQITGLTRDNNLGPFPIGFSMPFYGQNFTEFRVCSNGWLSFTSNTTYAYGINLPGISCPPNLIAPLMRALDLTTAGTVHYQRLDGDTLVLQFTNAPRHQFPASLCTFQVLMKRDGTIFFYYKRVDDPTVGLVGMQNAAKNQGITLALNKAFLSADFAVRIQPAWLGFTPTSGTIPVGSTATVTVSGNTAGMGSGNYTANLIVNSNDWNSPVQTVPVNFTVRASPPTITAWPTATSLVYGQALSASTLSGGTASVAGTFAFDSPATVPSAGTQSVPVTFTPADTATAGPVTGSVNVVVAKATPVVTAWPTASPIASGQPLSASVLSGGTASVAGAFTFNSPTTVLNPDTQSVAVTFTPADTTNYQTVTGTVQVQVQVGISVTVTAWPTASAIVYGQALSASTLTGGTASVAGTFTFNSPNTLLDAGTRSVAVTFTPADAATYNSAQGSVSVVVAKATPVINASPTASAIVYRQALSASTLSGGTASVAGAFAFSAPTTVLNAGTPSVAVTFTPTDTANYNPAQVNVSVVVAKITSVITASPWASAIVYGQALSVSALTGGKASVAGAFAFSAPTTVLNAGTYSVPVTFTPTDTVNYNPASGSVALVVTKATPIITAWPTASATNYGQYLTASTLSGGSASVGGTFAFNDPTLFAGSDAFTFKVNDGTVDSPPATVNIAVGSAFSPNEYVAPAAISLTNYSFEYPVQNYGGYQYAPSGEGTGWTFSSGAGVAASNSIWFTVSAPDGFQACFLENTGSSISQSVNFPTAGTYTIIFSAIGSSYFGSMPTKVQVDGVDVLSLSATQILTNGWKIFTANNFTVSAGAHTIAFVNGTLSGEHATAIDAVKIVPVNLSPIANAQSVSVEPGTPKAITLTGSDPNGDPLTYEILTQPTYGTLSGTPPLVTYTQPALPAAGAHSVAVTFTPADTANYQTVTNTVSVPVNPAITTYADWSTQYPGHDLSNASADNDGDGLNNFHEYAFGLNPTSGNSNNPIVSPLNKANHSFSYTRRANSSLTYTVCISTDLNGWQDLLPSEVTENVSVNAETHVETVGVTISSTSLPATNNLFLRVKAQ